MTAPADRIRVAETFASQLLAAVSLEQYSEIVARLLTASMPGLLMTVVPVEQTVPMRLSALVAATRHRLTPPPAAVVPRRERPAARYPRRSR